MTLPNFEAQDGEILAGEHPGQVKYGVARQLEVFPTLQPMELHDEESGETFKILGSEIKAVKAFDDEPKLRVRLKNSVADHPVRTALTISVAGALGVFMAHRKHHR